MAFIAHEAPSGVILEAFWRLFGTFLGVWGNSENCNPSVAKTMVWTSGEGPESHFFGTFPGYGF